MSYYNFYFKNLNILFKRSDLKIDFKFIKITFNITFLSSKE